MREKRTAQPKFYDFTGEYASTEIRECIRSSGKAHPARRAWRKLQSVWKGN
jgi:hypothetical protein